MTFQNSPPTPLLNIDYSYAYDSAKERGENKKSDDGVHFCGLAQILI